MNKRFFFQAADMFSTSRILTTIMKICFESGQLDVLNEHLILLTKRRGQLKQVIQLVNM